MMTDVRSSGVNILIDVVPKVQLTLYIRMGERISAGVPQVRLIDVELAASASTGDGYAVQSNIQQQHNVYCALFIIYCLIIVIIIIIVYCPLSIFISVNLRGQHSDVNLKNRFKDSEYGGEPRIVTVVAISGGLLLHTGIHDDTITCLQHTTGRAS